MLSFPEHKGWNYFKAEGTQLQEKRSPRELNFKDFSKKTMKTSIKTLTVSMYPKIT